MIEKKFSLESNNLAEALKLSEIFCSDEHHLNKEVCFRIRLVYEELITNMFKHAVKLGASWVKVKMENLRGEISLSFQYDGEEFNPTTYKDRRVSEEFSPEKEKGGLGLFLVMNFSKEFNYCRENGVNILSVKI